MESVHEHLREVGGGGRFRNLIGPNNLDEYSNIRVRLRDIEVNDFIQVIVCAF